MPTNLTEHAIEKSTYIVTIYFYDEDGNAVTPNNIHWKLTDILGNVINDRNDVEETPAESIDIVLSENDLVSDDKQIVLCIWGTYNSSIGNDLPLKDEVGITIDNLKNF